MTAAMFSKSFEEMGIPTGYGFKQLLFSPLANTMVLHASSATNDWRPERIYFRHTRWVEYRQVGNPGELDSQESPFIHSVKPLLAFTTMQHSFSIDADGRELRDANWHSLQIVDLESGLAVRSIEPESLQAPTGFTRFWICEFVAFGEQGLFVKAALSKSESLIEYFVAELSTENLLKPIALLPATFF